MGVQERREEIQERHLKLLALHTTDPQPSFQFTETFFPYTSGQIGPYYVQSIAITASGPHYAEAIAGLRQLLFLALQEGYGGFDVVSGGESRDWDFSNPFAVEEKRAHAKIYKGGTIIGADVEGRNVLHIADLNNEGSSFKDLWVPAVGAHGGNISRAFFYVDRLEDGVRTMADLNIPYDAVIPLNQRAWDLLKRWDVVSDEVYNQLSARMEDKQSWAHSTLRAHPERLEELLKNPKTVAKGEKILLKGYPELRDELLDRMAQRGYRHVFMEVKR